MKGLGGKISFSALFVITLMTIGCSKDLDTSKWQSYSDNDDFFTIQYPIDWSHQLGGKDGFKIQGDLFESPDKTDYLIISSPDTTYQNLKEGLKTYPYGSVELLDVQSVSLNSYNAAFGSAKMADDSTSNYYFISTGTKSYFIYYPANSAFGETIINTLVFKTEVIPELDEDELVSGCSSNLLIENTVSSDNLYDLKTYSNQRGFSLDYPADWGEVEVKTFSGLQNGYNGWLEGYTFGRARFASGLVKDTISFAVSSSDFKQLYDKDDSLFNFSLVDFKKSEEDLSQDIKLNYTAVMQVEKVEVSGKQALKLKEYGTAENKCFERYHYLIPDINEEHDNLSITGGLENINEVNQIVETLKFETATSI